MLAALGGKKAPAPELVDEWCIPAELLDEFGDDGTPEAEAPPQWTGTPLERLEKHRAWLREREAK